MPIDNRSVRRNGADPDLQTDFSALLFPDPTQIASNNVCETKAAVSTQPATTWPAFSFNTFSQFLPIYQVQLALTGSVPLHDQPKVENPSDVAELLSKYLEYADREHLVSLLLNAKNRLIGTTTISIGDLSSAIVHPREVFKPAILANASQILVAHNHPSGDPSPSSDDRHVTERLVKAGEVLGIDVIDHIVLGSSGRYVSFKESGYM